MNKEIISTLVQCDYAEVPLVRSALGVLSQVGCVVMVIMRTTNN